MMRGSAFGQVCCGQPICNRGFVVDPLARFLWVMQRAGYPVLTIATHVHIEIAIKQAA